MTATLSFELKPVMKHLTKDERWNMLTALILHANIRNRAYPSMQTLADMATGGNLHKATSAKKWLEKHGAFSLVEYSKRVEDEKNCGKRQHIYQLTGTIKGCGDVTCDCWQTGEYRYLYFSKQGVPDIVPTDNIAMGNVVPVDNITPPEVAPIRNIVEADIVPTDNVNGYKGSITKETEVLKDKSAAPDARALIDLSPDVAQIIALFDKNPRQPDIKEVEAELKKYPLENILAVLRKNKNNPQVKNLWLYSKPAFGDVLKPTPVSPNGPKQPETAVARAQRQQFFTPKKASSQ